jgi:hypothetical protein
MDLGINMLLAGATETMGSRSFGLRKAVNILMQCMGMEGCGASL